jgi:hypothetical protein
MARNGALRLGKQDGKGTSFRRKRKINRFWLLTSDNKSIDWTRKIEKMLRRAFSGRTTADIESATFASPASRVAHRAVMRHPVVRSPASPTAGVDHTKQLIGADAYTGAE